MNILERLRQRFAQVTPMPAGLHHLSAVEDEKPYRLHLRMHPDGSGVLIVNAATILHLNATATEYAYHLIRGSTDEQAARQIAARYRVSRKQARADFQDFAGRIQTLVHTPDLDPISYLDFDRIAPHSESLTAPLRLDCALTYRLPDSGLALSEAQGGPVVAPVKRVEFELTTEEWQTIIENAWIFGIPHIIFTGGEATLRDDLPALIAHAEANGQVTGLLTDGLKLADDAYLETLLQTGLDHLLFILQPNKTESWRALQNIMPKDIFTAVHITVTENNAAAINDHLRKVAELGVTALSLSGAPEFKDTLRAARDYAAELNLLLVWDLPVPYSSSHPVALETAVDQVPSGAGQAWMYVEPDGDVLPAQGQADHVLGNLLKNTWAEIYK